MSENKGYDPFSDSARQSGVSNSVTNPADEPTEHLFATSGQSEAGDGWEPIVEEVWVPPTPIGDLDSLILEDGSASVSNSKLEIDYSKPSHHNPLPTPADPLAASAESRDPMRDSDSNEAIMSMGRDPADLPSRERLPSRADAPLVSPMVEPRPIAWLLPGLVAAAGIGAGFYVFSETNPILGSIAVALSLVGALFLRVFLKQ